MDPVTTKAVANEPESLPAVGEPESGGDAAELIAEELLVEEVSIDGMCGVY